MDQNQQPPPILFCPLTVKEQIESVRKNRACIEWILIEIPQREPLKKKKGEKKWRYFVDVHTGCFILITFVDVITGCFILFIFVDVHTGRFILLTLGGALTGCLILFTIVDVQAGCFIMLNFVDVHTGCLILFPFVDVHALFGWLL